jgi:hypothetical protein
VVELGSLMFIWEHTGSQRTIGNCKNRENTMSMSSDCSVHTGGSWSFALPFLHWNTVPVLGFTFEFTDGVQNCFSRLTYWKRNYSTYHFNYPLPLVKTANHVADRL